MFEISVACKYLIPRRRQLSVSIISLISILVVSLVVWLIIVFFSVTDGLEKNWIQKLTTLTAPVRMIPTEAYYQSYYHRIDSISESSNYSLKNLREKRLSSHSDPYNPHVDEEIPSSWPLPEFHQNGSFKDLVKLPFSFLESLKTVPGVQADDYEITGTELALTLFRSPHLGTSQQKWRQAHLNYSVYLGNLDPFNTQLSSTIAKISPGDVNNLLRLLDLSRSSKMISTHFDDFHQSLERFFSVVTVSHLKIAPAGWTLSRSFLPQTFEWVAASVVERGKVVKIFIPEKKEDLLALQKELNETGISTTKSVLKGYGDQLLLSFREEKDTLIPEKIPLVVIGKNPFQATLEKESVWIAKQITDLIFDFRLTVQNTLLQGKSAFKGLEIAQFKISSSHSSELPWVHLSDEKLILPNSESLGQGILLPKSFKEAGVLIGDQGTISYIAPTTSTIQEQYIPIYVAGFYDPGIIPIGGKFILADRSITSLVRSSYAQEENLLQTNGINVRFTDLKQVDEVKALLQNYLKSEGIDRYWNVLTYKDYDFTKEMLQELQSQKNLFLLISVVIIIVACSNIISMLVILVNDKKVEIGILRSMGASSMSIACIFGIAGAFIGLLGSLIGIGASLITLKYLSAFTHFLSYLQGHQMFSSSLYGEALPNAISWEALSFVCIATFCLSLIAGIVPAIKACLVQPSQIFKSAGA